jgi:hypothetical protein
VKCRACEWGVSLRPPRDHSNYGTRGVNVQHLRVLSPSFLSPLMSLDFFFVPLAAKVGASLDQVKVSLERGAQGTWEY